MSFHVKKHLVYIFAVSFFLLLHFSSLSNSIDSLQLVLKDAKADSIRVPVMVKLAIAFEVINTDSSYYYYHAAAVLAQDNKWYRKTGNVYYNMGIFSHYTMWSDTSIQFVRKAAHWYRKADNASGVLNCLYTEGTYWMNFEKLDSAIFCLEIAAERGAEISDSIYLNKIYNNLGLAYQYTGQLEKAIAYMLLSIQEKEKYNPNDLASAYINIGLNYLNTNNTQEAIKYCRKGYKEGLKFGSLNAMGLSLKNMGDAFSREGQFDSTYVYYKKAKKVFEQMNDSNHISRYYMSTSEALAKQGFTQQAEDSLDMALIFFPSHGSPRLRIHTLITQSNFKLAKDPNSKELKEVEKMALEAYQLCNETGLLKENAKASRLLFIIYSLMNRNDLAVKYGDSYMQLNDSLFNDEQSEALAKQRAKFETEKKEIEITFLNKANQLKSMELEQNEKLQKKQQTIIYLLNVGVIFTVIFIGVVLKLYAKKQATNKILNLKNHIIQNQNGEKEILLKEIHHRVKNNLQIIWSLLDLQSNSIDDPKVKLAITDGKNRINSMSMIHQMLYQNDDAGNIQFKEYLNKLILQIKSTFSNATDTEVVLRVPDDLRFDIDTSIPLGLIITELITNAFKYAFTDQNSKTILVNLESLGSSQFQLKISDNGIGVPKDFDISKSKSLGLRLVRNLSKQIKGSVEMESQTGTTFVISFRGETFKLES